MSPYVGRNRGIYTHPVVKLRDPRLVRVIQIRKEIRSAKTVDTVRSLESIVDNERGFIGEKAYRELRLLAAKRMNKVGPKEKTLDLGIGKVGFRSEGKIL